MNWRITGFRHGEVIHFKVNELHYVGLLFMRMPTTVCSSFASVALYFFKSYH